MLIVLNFWTLLKLYLILHIISGLIYHYWQLSKVYRWRKLSKNQKMQLFHRYGCKTKSDCFDFDDNKPELHDIILHFIGCLLFGLSLGILRLILQAIIFVVSGKWTPLKHKVPPQCPSWFLVYVDGRAGYG